MWAPAWCSVPPDAARIYVVTLEKFCEMKHTKEKLKNFVATVQENRVDDIHKIAASMKAGGCTIEQVLEITGIITGKVADLGSLEKYKKEGLATIEAGRKTTRGTLSELRNPWAS